ncbi:MAG: PD-(D/E)XK nuclease family protein [Acidobacteriota bacterium]
MISPRRTRLVRVRHLPAFRQAILESIRQADQSGVVIVPNAGAATQLRRMIARRQESSALELQHVTRQGLYDCLHERLADPPRRLTRYDREALVRAAAREVSLDIGGHRDSAGLREPGELRPALVTEVLRLYDQLRRQRQQVTRFEELLEETLQRDAELDRGAERMLRQTRMLAATFRAYERRMAGANACDEHSLRAHLMATPAAAPVRAAIVTVADWIAEPGGLSVADFDLLARLPLLATIDIVATEGMLASGFHQRIHDWLPGIEEIHFDGAATPRPRLAVPDDGTGRLWFTARDREEELADVARRLKPDGAEKRTAVVYKRPLPYLYVAREVFGSAGIAYRTSDALPLAAEPFAAAVDLVLEVVASSFTRTAVVALLRSPHFAIGHDAARSRDAVSALDRALSDARYLGDLARLSQLADDWRSSARPPIALQALDAAIIALEHLAPLRAPAPTTEQIGRVLSFLDIYAAPDRNEPRTERARAAVLDTLEGLAAASRAYDDAPLDVHALASLVRRSLEDQTFATDADGLVDGLVNDVDANELQLVDDLAARYDDFDQMTIVGLVEGDWPERPLKNIFYSSTLLQALGWPSEKDWRSAADAHFLDLLTSPGDRMALSTITLDDETLVEVSALVDEVPRAGLSTVACGPMPDARIFMEEMLSLDPAAFESLAGEPRSWAMLRVTRSNSRDAAFHGEAGAQSARAWAVSALETYLDCPFKFFAQRILRLEEEPDDEEVMDPRRQGQFVHEVFEKFFRRWADDGRHAVTPDNLADARATFEEVVDESLGALTDTEASLERTRMLGSSAASGLGEAVLRMEAERPVGVVGRLLEHKLEGEFTVETSTGPRIVRLRGKADRVDLLEDGTFRLIDYKLGWPPNRTRALQLPIYGLCAEQQLSSLWGKPWRLREAAYLAFKGPKRVVPLFAPGDRERVLREAQQRLVDAIDAIERGEFPPHPQDVYRCETCAFTAVCRKDYVGDV